MSNSKFHNSTIAGIVSVVPPKIRSFSEDSKFLNIDEKQVSRIKKNIGLDKRHVVDENTTTLDLCLSAADDLIAGLGINKSEIDCLIFVTQTPDHFQPCNAAISHGRLGLEKNCAAFDVALGCSGWVYGLWLAHTLIESRASSKVLLLAGDTLSKCVSEKDRSVGPLFGDCGTATLIEFSDQSNPTFFSLHTDGKGADHIKIPAGAFRNPPSSETAMEFTTADGNTMTDQHLQMNGGEVFNFSVSVEPDAIEELLSFSEQTKESVDFVVFHQANKYIISNIVRRIKIPLEKAPMSTVEKYGNQSSASIPCTVNDSLNEIVSSSRKKILFSGFGVGLSWASCLTDVKLRYCPAVKIYKG